jgi:hypothetical protein
VNITNVVLKATVMPEWRKIFEAEDSDLPELGAMEVCSSTEMDAPGASHLGTGGHGPKTDRSKPRSVPETPLWSLGRIVEKLMRLFRANTPRSRDYP